MTHARSISMSWELPREISFIVEFYDGTKRNFYFAQQLEGFKNYILYDADAHYGWDDPMLNITMTYKTSWIIAISKCLAVLEDQFSDYKEKSKKSTV